MRCVVIICLCASLSCPAKHLVNRQEAQLYLKNMDTIVFNHSGVDRIVFNKDTIYVKMQQAATIPTCLSVEQIWVNRHPVIFTLVLALLAITAMIEVFKLVLKK